ncbi:Ribosomal RNA small subunit methyltransferase E [Emticicia oligotrophica DSM 17448]|uniref:Ribosomal RNA small subunit methyltransferase E n=1 Tax=Emticicia oligotrophica (strain DSM 17448 / CIP 109782 / MTCC 6937 / GPTSA100-15) TaxID=929562 RepID=A0ABM5N6T6_EMTOG|nr:16S rRNA (uracil(1498)-N(3))-methyltransferase [Emticicia oligotrophica]AFK05202.1 Ribosomal RNA small subunit methyltransferase E [Emticicia oligotrophica DSM 17448]
MLLFYQSDIVNNQVLSEEDSRHCIKVLRKNIKDIIHIVDGVGGLYQCEIIKTHEKKCEVRILSTQKDFEKRDIYLHIAIAPTKNADRIEYFLEKCVEIGVDEISLIQTKHSERKNQKTERLEKIAISAMKQSLKAYLPKINELQDFDKFIENNKSTTKFIAHLTEDAKPLKEVVAGKKDVLVMIGPEGDFTHTEVSKAREKGFQIVTLGNSRLRTETAGVVACTIVNAFY